MITHPDSELIRRLLCGSARVHKLAGTAHDAAGNLSDRLGITAPHAEPAPTAPLTPAAAVGAFPHRVHATNISSQVQQDHE